MKNKYVILNLDCNTLTIKKFVGCEIRKCELLRHQKTKKHIEIMSKKASTR